MTILLTGASGFLGRRIVDSLLRAGQRELRLAVRQSASTEGLRAQAAACSVSADVRAANLLSREQVGEIVKDVDTIIHAAAGTRGGAADMFMNSVVGTRNLLDAAASAGVRRIVLISSFSVYDTGRLSSGGLLDEDSPLEPDGVQKGAYAFTKVQQEILFRSHLVQSGTESVIVRPGVIFGPGGSGMSSRVGISVLGTFASLGGSNTLPLTYVDNCADAIVQATLHGQAGAVLNVVDDDLPTCGQYLKRYRAEVRRLRAVPVPYLALLWGSACLQRYSLRSKGQLPAILTPYVVKAMYRPVRYSNARLKALGWTPRVAMEPALRAAMTRLREEQMSP